MNYRHAFHAGNHTELFKHAALTFVLERLCDKPQPFVVLDTHAGIGFYDLEADEAQRTGEAAEGIGRVFPHGLASAQAYSRMIAAMNPDGLKAYPGSPEIVRRFLRPQDRLMACELHPADAETLRARYRRDPQIAVHHRDGYEAIGGLLPPPEKRGLVFIDPPYEKTDEARTLARAVTLALKRWPTGIVMAWYPIKDGRIGDTLTSAACAAPWPKALRAEFFPYGPDEASLPGSGLIVCNTPWKLDQRLQALCAELSGRVGTGHGRFSLDWLTPA